MTDLIETIHAAMSEGATAEARAAGVSACQTILTALGATPGTPLMTPAASPASLLAGLDLGKALDLVIARLQTAVAGTAAPSPSPAFQVELVRAPGREER